LGRTKPTTRTHVPASNRALAAEVASLTAWAEWPCHRPPVASPLPSCHGGQSGTLASVSPRRNNDITIRLNNSHAQRPQPIDGIYRFLFYP
jgi:hypothetical protein